MKKKKIYETDPYLMPFKTAIDVRHERILKERDAIAKDGSLAAGVNNHLYYGLHHNDDFDFNKHCYVVCLKKLR